MLRFKQFSGSGQALERTINDWLAEFEPDVNQMAQTTREDGTIVLSFLFQESFRGQERRFTSESQAKQAASFEASSPDSATLATTEPQTS